jgi:hypothetical protein
LFSTWALGPRAALGSARCLNAAARSLPQCGGSAGARRALEAGPVRAHGLPPFSSAAQRAGAAALRAAASGGAGGRRKREPPPATVGRKLADAPSVAARRTGKHAPRIPRVPKDVAARVAELEALGEGAAAQAKGMELLQVRRPSWRCGVRAPLSAEHASVFCCTGCHARAVTPAVASRTRAEPGPRAGPQGLLARLATSSAEGRAWATAPRANELLALAAKKGVVPDTECASGPAPHPRTRPLNPRPIRGRDP